MAAAVRICLCFKSLQSLTAAALLGRSIWCWGPQGPLIRVCEVSMDVSFSRRFQWDHRWCVRLRRLELSLILLKVVFAASGASDQDVWGVYECIFHGGSTSDVGGQRYRRFSRQCPYQPALYTLTSIFWGRGAISSCRLLTAAALSSLSDVIRIVFYLPMSPSLVCWISLTAIRKKVAMVPQERGLRREGNKRRSCGSELPNL